MLKIFLVEDEFIVREGIKNIEWANEGFQFCGEAADGELALPLIQSEQPDIIITDIRMPFMDGLELSRIVKKELPKCKIIILSGHEEFSYAQEAISIGVTQYLLKPINSSELTDVVKRIGRQIAREREERDNYERYKREMSENEQALKVKLFNEMVSGSRSGFKIIESGRELGLKLSAKHYQIVLLKYNLASYDEAFSTELLSLTEKFRELDTCDNIILFDRVIEGWALLVKGDSPEHLHSVREEYLAKVKALFNQYPAVRYFGGIGTIVDRLARLSESFEAAQRAFAQRFILEQNDIIGCEVPMVQRQDAEGMLSDVQELGSLNLNMVHDFLKGGEICEIDFFVEKLLSSIGSASERSLLFRQYVLVDIYLTVINFLKNIGEDEVLPPEPFSKPEQMNELVNDPQKAKSYLIRIFTEALKRREVLSTKRYHRIIEQAKEYISRHYNDDDLSLNDIAEHVNISPSHFSSVFSRETGQSFIRYLTDQRMGKAKELLKCSDLRCSEIGANVGYKDPHYFSYLFKKLYNCSPLQYRASKG